VGSHLPARIAEGAAAGVAGTGALSATIFAAKTAGKIPMSAPHEISWRFHDKTGAPLVPVWGIGHFAYGAACGGLFFAVRRWLPRSPVLAGVGYGLGVWAVSYLALMPALSLYPPARWDWPPRRRTMIAGHALFGLVLGLWEARRRA
jgi:hypothetical protein